LGYGFRFDCSEYPSRCLMFGCTDEQIDALSRSGGVKEVFRSDGLFPLVSKRFRPGPQSVEVILPNGDSISFGGAGVPVIAGPCAVEDAVTTMLIAQRVKECGVRLFRGGAYKPRTSPYTFQGMGEEGLQILREVRQKFGLGIVTEILNITELEKVAEVADVLQVGTRNMGNIQLLKELGTLDKPVLLKRGMSATIQEFLMAAEYILAGGNKRVILCERGIRTFEPSTRFTLDISAIPTIKKRSHLPIIIDPSHATGDASLVESVSLGGIAAGADGLLIEVHTEPGSALSDGSQALPVAGLPNLLKKLAAVAAAVDRYLEPKP